MSQKEETVQQQDPEDFAEDVSSETATAETSATNPFAEFGGEEVQVEKRQRDAHRATIQSVVAATSEKGSHEVKVAYISDDTGTEIRQDIWVPSLFAERTGEFLTGKLHLTDLPPGEPDPDRPGKLKGNQRAHYGMSVKNSAGDASIQQLLIAAARSGRTSGPLAQQFNEATTFEEYCAALNEILGDLQVIVTRTPETSDDNPRGFLRVRNVYPISMMEDAKEMKKLAKYVRHWEIQ